MPVLLLIILVCVFLHFLGFFFIPSSPSPLPSPSPSRRSRRVSSVDVILPFGHNNMAFIYGKYVQRFMCLQMRVSYTQNNNMSLHYEPVIWYTLPWRDDGRIGDITSTANTCKRRSCKSQPNIDARRWFLKKNPCQIIQTIISASICSLFGNYAIIFRATNSQLPFQKHQSWVSMSKWECY